MTAGIQDPASMPNDDTSMLRQDDHVIVREQSSIEATFERGFKRIDAQLERLFALFQRDGTNGYG